jgi:hypothetical protein
LRGGEGEIHRLPFHERFTCRMHDLGEFMKELLQTLHAMVQPVTFAHGAAM